MAGGTEADGRTAGDKELPGSIWKVCLHTEWTITPWVRNVKLVTYIYTYIHAYSIYIYIYTYYIYIKYILLISHIVYKLSPGMLLLTFFS